MLLFMPVDSPSLLPLLTDAVPPPRPWWRRVLRHAIGWALGLTATGLGLTLVVWLGLHWFILPHIDQWRAEIETRTSQAVGVPVRLGSIQVQSQGWAPTIELRDVVFHDAQGRAALVLPRVLASLSPRSVLALELRLRQLVIDGAHLEIERDAQGRLSVAGLRLQTDPPGGGSAGLNWLFRQQEIAIRGSSLRWTDLQRQAPPLALKDVQLVIRNGLRHHALRLDATPPADWGQRFSLRGRFDQSLLADSGDWAHWSGTLYSELPQADMSQLKRYMALPFALEEGQGGLRAWIELRDGQPRAATVDVALRAVAAQLAPGVTPLALQKIQGRLSGERDGDTTRVALAQFGFTTEEGLEWPRSDLSLSWRQAPGQPLGGGEFAAQRLDLDLMARVANHLPLGDAVRRALAQTQPHGLVQGLEASWEGPLEAPLHYKLKGQVRELALTPLAAPEPEPVAIAALAPGASASAPPVPLGRPGVRSATLELSATEKGGRAQVQVVNGDFSWPGLWEEPEVPLKEFSALVQWRIDPPRMGGVAAVLGGAPEAGAEAEGSRLTVEVSQARIANEDLEGELRASWTRGPAPPGQPNPGVLDLSGQLQRGHADRVARYLPQRLPQATRHYLAHALQGGRLSDTSFLVKGDLRGFPFRPPIDKNQPSLGEFSIKGRVDELNLAYVPDRPAHDDEPAWVSPWPLFTGVAGEVIFERGGMQIRNARGQYQGVQIGKVQVGIKELSRHGVLALEGQAQGPLADLLGFVAASPLSTWTGQALARAQADGRAELKLALNMPLLDAKAATLKGSLALAGNALRLNPELPPMSNLQGRVEFTQRGFSLGGLTAQMLGGESRFEGGWQPDGGLRLEAQGSITAEGLRKATEWGGVARLAQFLSGQASYRLGLGWAHGRPEVTLTSNGQGLASTLPAPLAKSAEMVWPLRLQTLVTPPDAPSAPATRDTLRLTLGPQVQALYTRELGAGQPRVLRGQIQVSGPATSASAPAERAVANTAGVGAVHADIALARLDLDAWRSQLAQLSAPAVATPEAGAANTGAGAMQGYLPGTLSVRTDELLIASRKLQKVVAQVRQDDGVWRTQLDAEQLNGQIDYHPARGGANAQVVARLARFSLPQSDAAQVDALLQQPSLAAASAPASAQPDSVPALDIVIDDFELRGKKLGRLEIEASHSGMPEVAAGVREWRLSRLLLSTPEAQLSATGQWVPTEAASGGKPVPRRVTVDFKLDLSDSGAFVERLGMGRTIRGGKGLMSGQLSWIGSPLTLDHGITTGQMNVAIEAGQFLKAEPGAARLLSVLSLQALPRRLILDFRDVFQEGFAFDGITGDIKLAQGVASTNNLRMRGVQAVVLMEGSADLRHETQDLRVVVVPDINAGTASLAYAVINPALGLGTFLAQLFLRKPLAQASTREFRITGSWADPQVARVDHKGGDEGAGAAGDEAASRR